MNLTLITSMPGADEVNRLREEATNLGHNLQVIHLKDIHIYLESGTVKLANFNPSDTDVIIVRGALHFLRPLAPLLASWRKAGIRVFENNLIEHQYSIDKAADLTKLALAGIPLPKTFYCHGFDTYPTLAEILGYPVIVKGTRTGRGIGVYKADNEKELEELVQNYRDTKQKAGRHLMQEYIPYEHDLRVLIVGPKTFCMKRIPSDGEFRANFSLGGKVELFPITPEIDELAHKAIRALGMTVAGVDVLVSPQGMHILEVNHSPGFMGMEQATGENVAQIFLTHAIAAAK